MSDEQKQAVLAACSSLLDRTIGVAGVDGEFGIKYNTKCGGLVNVELFEHPRLDLKKLQNGTSLTKPQRSSN